MKNKTKTRKTKQKKQKKKKKTNQVSDLKKCNTVIKVHLFIGKIQFMKKKYTYG